jgi:multidrug efflux pump subunit AcrB
MSKKSRFDLAISGRLAAFFQTNPLTPVLAMAGLLLGLIATIITPREEEPQIDVTFVQVMVPMEGATARNVEQMICTPLEQKLSEIEGVKHVYSVSRPGLGLLTVEYEVGVTRESALVRIYNQVYSNQDWLPREFTVGQPLIKPKGIDDVPVMSLTLWTDDSQRSANDLSKVALSLESELKRIPGTRNIRSIGIPNRAILVTLDPNKLASYQIDVSDLVNALKKANIARHLGERVEVQEVRTLTAGTFFASSDDVRDLVVGLKDGQPLLLSDVAQIEDRSDTPTQYVWHGAPPGVFGPSAGTAPAVTIEIAKKPGSNASEITTAVARRLEQLKGELIPDGVEVEVTRDYGKTATDKAQKLIQKLLFATISVVLLVLLSLGWREALVVGSAVVLTLALTLFASWSMGFTLNRVSLFALIFSIGVLVDDAIVVVESIHRHRALGNRSLLEIIPLAVDEIGGPTILATLTVVASLLPMAFVTGLMGPYMRPIPINASVGMLISLVIALTVTPWLSLKVMRKKHPVPDGVVHTVSSLKSAFERIFSYFLNSERAKRNRLRLYAGIMGLVFFALSLVAINWVVLKMLPFDNKSELQVMVDLPEGATLEDTQALLSKLAVKLDQLPEVLNYQGYAGTSAPINFNGLVRQYFLRSGSTVGDLQVNLVDKNRRHRQSHDIALAIRPLLVEVAKPYRASLKIIEVPPGPPVLSPIVAEVYGPNYDQSRLIGQSLKKRFESTAGIVDVDSSVEENAFQEQLIIDQVRAARLGIAQSSIVDALTVAALGLDVTYLHNGRAKNPIPIRLRLSLSDRTAMDRLLAMNIKRSNGLLVPLSELVKVQKSIRDQTIYHKDLLPVVYVTGDEASDLDSPLYGVFDLVAQLKVKANALTKYNLQQFFIDQSEETHFFSIKWDGEWQITFETFRDMGMAYAVGVLLIYLLLVAQFHGYIIPLIIMVPIPLTLIGVLPGHALMGAHFTATSMIGMIALAGIIVRNSILLVDSINHSVAEGASIERAVIDACYIRAKPIALTALAAMLGAFFILDDPIFNGLAISLIFGILVSTVLTLVIIPVLYFAYLKQASQNHA